MIQRYFLGLLMAASAMAAPMAWAAPVTCTADNEVLASPAGDAPMECLRLKAFLPAQPDSAADKLLVWLHGDLSSAGETPPTKSRQATYLLPIAERAMKDHTGQILASVALVRPGYRDEQDVESAGEWNNGRDHYTEANMPMRARGDGDPDQGVPVGSVRGPNLDAVDALEPVAVVAVVTGVYADGIAAASGAGRNVTGKGHGRHDAAKVAEDRDGGHRQRAAGEGRAACSVLVRLIQKRQDQAVGRA